MSYAISKEIQGYTLETMQYIAGVVFGNFTSIKWASTFKEPLQKSEFGLRNPVMPCL